MTAGLRRCRWADRLSGIFVFEAGPEGIERRIFKPDVEMEQGVAAFGVLGGAAEVEQAVALAFEHKGARGGGLGIIFAREGVEGANQFSGGTLADAFDKGVEWNSTLAEEVAKIRSTGAGSSQKRGKYGRSDAGVARQEALEGGLNVFGHGGRRRQRGCGR